MLLIILLLIGKECDSTFIDDAVELMYRVAEIKMMLSTVYDAYSHVGAVAVGQRKALKSS
jgi:hypothetical protein